MRKIIKCRKYAVKQTSSCCPVIIISWSPQVNFHTVFLANMEPIMDRCSKCRFQNIAGDMCIILGSLAPSAPFQSLWCVLELYGFTQVQDKRLQFSDKFWDQHRATRSPHKGLCGRDWISGEHHPAVTVLMKIESLSATIFSITFP